MPAPPTERCQYTTAVEGDHFTPEEEPLLTVSDGTWQCPHYALEGCGDLADRCPFHTPPDCETATVEPAHGSETVLRLVRGRESPGVGGTTLPEPLVTYLDRTYETGAVTPAERTQLIGARLDGLQLAYQALDAPVNAPLDLREATISGPVSLTGVTVSQELDCSGAEFHARVDCVETTFNGRAQFRAATFREGADFHHAAFNSWARFDTAEFQGPANFRGVEFEHGIFAPEVEFRAAADFMTAECHALANFTDAVFARGGVFSSTRFHRNGTFRGTEFRSPVVLSENFVDDTDVDKRWNRVPVEDRVVPEAAVVFRNLTCKGTLKLTGASVDGDVYVTASRLHSGLQAPELRVETEAIEVNMAGTHTVSGTIETDRDAIEYDLTEATVGELEIPEGGITDVTFRRARFDGFDFGRYKRELAANDWALHDPVGSGPHDPREIENLYLRAKNGAAEIGENRASSQFFRREMRARQAAHWSELRADRDVESGGDHRLRAGGRWLSNTLLRLTSGYGEAPTRPVAFSLVVIGVFGAMYALVDAPIPYRTPVGYLTFSSEAFVALVLGQPNTTGLGLSSLVALEGFVGGFMIALFVFTLTRSIDR